MLSTKVFNVVYKGVSKAYQDTDVPTNPIEENAVIFTRFKMPSISNLSKMILSKMFSSNVHFHFIQNLQPVIKKNSKSSKDIYRPISTFKNIPKICNRVTFK